MCVCVGGGGGGSSVVIDSMSISIEKKWMKKRKHTKDNAEARNQFEK